MPDDQRLVFHLVTDRMFRFIHPLKQKNFENVYQHLPRSVEQLWVFGSSVTPNNRPDSDLDLLAVGNLSIEDRKAIIDAAGCEVDLIVTDRAFFSQKSKEFAHCFYTVVRNGILYFDREWLYE
ncbi:MAG: nucleotidyltransferase domain-containing protein [Clostridiales bacterium]|jgi:predicted nucleotidyltransferase|nr:nucleotidyltransferase domain-containing protein [Clostridiales bacterium]